jgi:hypothetical protein
MKNRINHWTCSKFADYLRGEKKPIALSLEDWENWRKEQKNKRPWRYWISETLLRKLQNFFCYPGDLIYSIKCYIRNRFVTQTHNLKTGLKKGEWYDLDTRILHGLFNELVEYVEIELAHLSKWDREKKYKFKNSRCVEAAYDYFEWASNLKFNEEYAVQPDDPDYGKLTPQAESTRKIKELYEWWVYQRPNRIDPYEAIKKETHGKHYFRNIDEIERGYEKEDTEKLIELIKIRNSLWT